MFTYTSPEPGMEKAGSGTLKESASSTRCRDRYRASCSCSRKESTTHMFVGTTGIDPRGGRRSRLIVEKRPDDVDPTGAFDGPHPRNTGTSTTTVRSIFGSETPSTNGAQPSISPPVSLKPRALGGEERGHRDTFRIDQRVIMVDR